MDPGRFCMSGVAVQSDEVALTDAALLQHARMLNTLTQTCRALLSWQRRLGCRLSPFGRASLTHSGSVARAEVLNAAIRQALRPHSDVWKAHLRSWPLTNRSARPRRSASGLQRSHLCIPATVMCPLAQAELGSRKGWQWKEMVGCTYPTPSL